MYDFANYWIPVLFLGTGLALDGGIATISRFHNEKLSFRNWSLALAFTHSAFPAFSYFLFWGAATTFTFSYLHESLGVIGFLFIAAVVYEILCEALGTDPRFSVSDGLSHLFRVDKSASKHFALVLSVSWDALMSGQVLLAEAANWTLAMMIAAFLIFGGFIAFGCTATLIVAKKLRDRDFSDVNKLAKFNLIGTLCEISIIGGFGINALWF